ncbi:hypothetical protein U9M48_009261 [Paspalum notatum var. saurae]|uniref:SAP domain-containing protein n=1 Tax=Paspalum notatum var. saurae TaxID=547442 RepID=A0AAQ3SQM5_PASNO
MFRNKVLVRAVATTAASTPLPPFLLRQLSLPAAAPIAAVDLEILCCRLSRRHHLACLPQPPADALLVFQRRQSREAAEVVSEIVAAFPGASVGEEEALVCAGSLVAKAVECELRSMMLEHGWRCLGESIYVDSKFDHSEERTDLCAEVRLGRNNSFEFVVSPDSFRYTMHKISDVAGSNMMETFQHNNEIVLDTCNLLTVCTTLPALQEGHVIGYIKMLPSEQCLDKLMELCLFKEQVLLNCSSTLPIWDKVTSDLTSYNSVADNTEDLDLSHTNIMSNVKSFVLDFRTPKPAVFCSLSANSWNDKVHKIAHPFDDNDNLSVASPIDDGLRSQLLASNSSYKYQHPDADNLNKSSHPDTVANHPNPVSSSSAILHMPVMQVSENHGRKRAELLKASGQGGGGITKDYRPGIKEVTKAIPDIEKKGVLTTKEINPELNAVVPKDEVAAKAKRKAKQDPQKNVLTAVTKQKTMPEVVNNEFSVKVRGNQNDDINKKVTKGRAKAVDKDLLNSTTRTKAKPDVGSDGLIEKVIDHHKRGELRLLTVADLKCFLGAKKAKVGGTKKALVQRVTELLA